jgi:outer membrane protein TolC
MMRFCTLQNNSAIQVQEAQVETAKFNLLHAYEPFDPTLQSLDFVNRYSYPGFSQIQGPGTFNQLSHQGQFTFSQTFPTGTNLTVQLNGTRYSSSSGFYFVNPNWNTTLNLLFTQPLLRNRWRFENRAPLVIARRNLQQSRATFESQVNAILLQTVQQYWDVVRASGNLEVFQQSFDAAQASYNRDKRALELGALPPLDIYRSQAEVASRRVQVIQAEYALKRAEDALRFTIGVDQDDYVAALDLHLTEGPEPVGELKVIDIGTALQEAMQKRPEVEAAKQALQGDAVSVRLAQNHLQPDLSFSGYGATLTLKLPIRNRAAQADLGSALVLRHRDLSSAQQVREQITLDVNMPSTSWKWRNSLWKPARLRWISRRKLYLPISGNTNWDQKLYFSCSTRRPELPARERVFCRRRSNIKTHSPPWIMRLGVCSKLIKSSLQI